MRVFVIMPFYEELQYVYEQLIKEPLEKEGHEVSRADDVKSHDYIPRRIIQNIRDYDIIIADLTGQNANVYYELGIAHTLDRPTIHIVQDLDELAFDIKTYSAIKYSTQFYEAAKLTNSILEIIGDAASGTYNFSNPVKDTIGDDLKKNNEATPQITRQDDDALGEEDGSLGVLDSIELAEQSMSEIGAIIVELNVPMNTLQERTERHAASFQELNADPHQTGLNSKRLYVARRFAADLNEFSDEFNTAVPRINSAWKSLDQGIGHVLSVAEVRSSGDADELSSLVEVTSEMKQGIESVIRVFGEFREAQRQIRGLSKATDRALSNADATLARLLDEFRFGDSVLTRIIELGQEKIEAYANCADKSGNDELRQTTRLPE